MGTLKISDHVKVHFSPVKTIATEVSIEVNGVVTPKSENLPSVVQSAVRALRGQGYTRVRFAGPESEALVALRAVAVKSACNELTSTAHVAEFAPSHVPKSMREDWASRTCTYLLGQGYLSCVQGAWVTTTLAYQAGEGNL